MAQHTEVAHTGGVARLRATPEVRRARSVSVLPWVVAGVAATFAVVVTIVLAVGGSGGKTSPQEPGASSGAFPVGVADGAMDTPMGHSGSDRPRPGNADMRPRPAGTILTGATLAKTAGELLASCSDTKRATSLFFKANRLRYQEQHRPWAKAAFTALLECKHAIHGQKMWSAYRLAQLHAKDGECDGAARAWQRWRLHGGPGKNPHLKQPKCP